MWSMPCGRGSVPAMARIQVAGRGKPGNVCVVACARELSCFLWAAAVAD